MCAAVCFLQSTVCAFRMVDGVVFLVGAAAVAVGGDRLNGELADSTDHGGESVSAARAELASSS